MTDDQRTLHALPHNTISLIGSCQVITSVYSVVKELVENSLDAKASSVDIKLEEYGLEKIEVVDNGSGVKALDVPFMGKRHFTSKIACSEDLNILNTYGFRGEALGSLCAVSNVTITTKTAEDQLSYVYTIGHEGDVLDKKPSHTGKGTVILSRGLFHNIPVRKQYCSASQRKKEDLKRIEHLLMAYAIIKPDLRLTLKHGKDLVFQKTALKDTKTALQSVIGRQMANQMLYKEKNVDEIQLKVSTFLPKPGSDVKVMSVASTEKTFVAVNCRPVSIPEINKILKCYYSNCHGLDIYRHPVCFISLDVATNQLDVNVDPNKTKVFFQQKTEILNALEEILVEIYGPLDDVPSWHYIDANGNGETKQIERNSSKVKNPTRPTITYSKWPNEMQDSELESSDNTPQQNQHAQLGTTKNGGANSPTIIPLTSHTKTSEQTHSVSSSGIAAECAEQGTTNDNIVDSGLSSNHSSDGNANGELRLDNTDVSEPMLQTGETISIVKTHSISSSGIAIERSEKLNTDDNIVDSSLSTNHSSNGNGEISIGNTEANEPMSQTRETIKDFSLEMAEELIADLLKNDNQGTPPLTKSKANVGDVVVIEQSETKEDRIPNEIHPDAWSRGSLSIGNSVLQPVSLLPPSSTHMPGKRPRSPTGRESILSQSQPRRKAPRLMLPPSNQTTLLDMMNTTSSKKPESSFMIFSQEKLPSLSQEFPDENETDLKKRVKEAWNDLSDDKRISYREKCWHETKRQEKQMSNMNDTRVVVRRTTTKGSEKIKRILKKRLYCKEKTIKIPINNIRNPSSDESTSSIKDSQLMVVGPAYKSDDVWFLTLHDKLYLANVWRICEVALYKKLKAEHQLPFKSCDPLTLDSRNLSESGLAVLDKLARENRGSGTFFPLTDERIVANGFDIRCHCDPNGNLTSELVGICGTVPSYDLKDLNKILDVLSSRQDAPLSETRTLKATYFLQGEAVRMTRQNTGKKTLHDVEELLSTAVSSIDQPCLHHKPIFKEVVDFTNFNFDND